MVLHSGSSAERPYPSIALPKCVIGSPLGLSCSSALVAFISISLMTPDEENHPMHFFAICVSMPFKIFCEVCFILSGLKSSLYILDENPLPDMCLGRICLVHSLSFQFCGSLVRYSF